MRESFPALSLDGRNTAASTTRSITHGSVDRQSLVHMYYDEIIVSGFGTRELLLVKLGRGLEQTQDGVNVSPALGLRYISPGKRVSATRPDRRETATRSSHTILF